MRENFTKLMTLAIAGVLTSSVMAQNATMPIIKGEAAKQAQVEKPVQVEKLMQAERETQAEKLAQKPIIQTRAAEVDTWPNYTVTYSPDGSMMFNKTAYEYDKAGRVIERIGYHLLNDDWVNSSKTVYEYDDADNQTLYEYYSWINNSWIISSKFVYEYDEAGNQTLYEYYFRENNSLIGDSKTVYEYDEAGNRTLYENYRWENNSWASNEKTVNKYDEAGNQTFYEYRRWENNSWVGSKNVSEYDEAGNQTLYENYRWENGSLVGSNKTIYEYDDKGEIFMYHYYKWDKGDWTLDSSNRYYPFSKRVDYIVDGENIRFGYPMGLGTDWYYYYSFPAKNKYDTKYDASGNLIFFEFLSGEGVTNTFNIKYDNNKPTLVELAQDNGIVYFKAEYEYDGDGRCTGFGQFYLDGSIWKPSGNRFIIAYDERGEISLQERHTRDWEKEVWVLVNKTINKNEYDAHDRVTLREYHYISDDYESYYKYVYEYDTDGRTTLNEFHSIYSDNSESYYKYVYEYDADGRTTLNEYHSINSDNSESYSKNIYEYDAKGRTISYEYYSSNSNSDYINHYKETYEFDSNGNQYLSRYYTSVNGDWEMMSYTVRYPNAEAEYVTNETITAITPNVYIAGNTLYIYGAQTEQVSVYSISGIKLYEAKVASDVTTINATLFPKGSVLIVKGSSGWVKKLIK